MMSNHCEMFQLFDRHIIWPHEVSHIHDVRLQQLVHGRIRIGRVAQRSDHAPVDRRKGVGNEPLLAQFAVDIAECRLLLVEAKKRDLRLDGDRLLQSNGVDKSSQEADASEGDDAN